MGEQLVHKKLNMLTYKERCSHPQSSDTGALEVVQHLYKMFSVWETILNAVFWKTDIYIDYEK